jgi:hypothetical protein
MMKKLKAQLMNRTRTKTGTRSKKKDPESERNWKLDRKKKDK